MDRTDYARLRAFAIETLGYRILSDPQPESDAGQAGNLKMFRTLNPAEFAAADMLETLAYMFLPFPGMLSLPGYTEPTDEDRARQAQRARAAACALAAHLPEPASADLLRLVDEVLPETPPPEAPAQPRGDL